MKLLPNSTMFYIYIFLIGFIKINSINSISNFAVNQIQYLFKNESALLSSHPACADDISALCGQDGKTLQSNLAILNCISEHSDAESKLSSQCQHQIWSFKYKISNLNHFTEITKMVCKLLLTQNQDCMEAENEDVLSPSANIISCLLERIQQETGGQCKSYLEEMEMIIFSDYRLIHKFANVCEPHIKQFQCGRLDDTNGENGHSQLSTIECLQNHIASLSAMCKHEILRISELQSDDFHLDKPLYFSCRFDREKFCKDVESGNGRVYKCLIKNMRQVEMSEECKNKLIQREQLVAMDYKISKSLVQSCKTDIKRYQCRANTSGRKEIRLAQILLCLENVHAKNLPLTGDCMAEMFLHRRLLIEDYKLTPSLAEACESDISQFCHEVEEGNILHCLMKHAKSKRHRGDAHIRRRISAKCQREIELVLKEANVGEDWRVDPVLQEACQSTVDSLCRNVKPGNARVLGCLAEHVDSIQMADECRETLNQMQYFVARNFELDSQMYEACHPDAVKHCHAKQDWNDDADNMDPERGPTVLACLYRYVYQQDDKVRLRKQCIHHIKRIMKQRAASVDLLPFIEEPCMQDLAKWCSSDRVVDKKGSEMECLQDNYSQLQSFCRNAIGNFTEAQSSHLELNYPLFKSCSGLIKEICPQEYDNSEEQGELIQCLIQNKNHYLVKNNPKCKEAIMHFQLTNLKDFRFDSKFKESCKVDIKNHCNNLRSKSEVVNCLSSIVYNDTISKQPRSISKECRNMLRVELFQLGEDIQLDSQLSAACNYDRRQYCSDVETGEAHVIECLKNNIVKLTRACQRLLFHKQYIELSDNSLDYSLLSICKIAINRFCFSSDLRDVLYCLRDHRNDPALSHNCRSLVIKRLMQQNQDYRLNPRLKIGCKKEINHYCSKIIRNRKPDELLDGKVIACLKRQYLHNALSQTCEIEIVNIIREVSNNIELDPILFRSCQKEISRKCSNEIDIHECLKSKFMSRQIEDQICKQEIARLIKETEADIESDPHLYIVCRQDLQTFCSDVVSGSGHQLNCLATIHRHSPRRLSQECDLLFQKRLQLFEYAAEVDPADSVIQMWHMVSKSPVHNYIYLVFMLIIASIFAIGIFCGRFSHSVAVNDKIK